MKTIRKCGILFYRKIIRKYAYKGIWSSLELIDFSKRLRPEPKMAISMAKFNLYTKSSFNLSEV